MQYAPRRRFGLLVALLAFLAMAGVSVAAPPAGQARAIRIEKLKPQWQVGDRWIVETTTLQSQVTDTRQAKTRSKPVRWQFSVQAVEQLAGRPCYRLQVQALAGQRQQPVTRVWVDQQTMTLRQVQMQLPIPGGFKTVTESYHTAGGAATPVLGPLSILPIDLPSFLPSQIKGAETFVYESVVGPGGTKAIGDVGFSYAVQQKCFQPKPENIKGLLDNAFVKDLQTAPVVEVRLKTTGRSVHQLWQPGQPWPSFSDNGNTQSRLVKVMPASVQPRETREVQP